MKTNGKQNINDPDFKFESPRAFEKRLRNDPIAKKEWDEYVEQKRKEDDKNTIIHILHDNPELLQEVIQKLRKYKLDKLK